MIASRTRHQASGETSVSAGDTWSVEIGDEYRRVVGVDLAGDVERKLRVEHDGQRFNVVSGGVSGEGDFELDIELEKGDNLVIEYEDSGTVSDMWLIRTDPPLHVRLAEQLVRLMNR